MCSHAGQVEEQLDNHPLGLWPARSNDNCAWHWRPSERTAEKSCPDARSTWGFAGSSVSQIARALRGNGVHIVSANVTTLFSRREFIPRWKFDILLIQEVNASEVKLQALRTFFQKHKLHLTWGHPRVPGIGETRTGPCCGGGCAILSRQVTVAVSVPLPGELKNCDRFHEAYIPLPGGVQVRVCSAYGDDSSQLDARDRTAALLQAIECRAREFPPGSKIIGMDVNCSTNKCTGAQNMLRRGWCDLLELGSQLRGEAKPATYETK